MTTDSPTLSGLMRPKFPPLIYLYDGFIKKCRCGSSLKIHYIFTSNRCISPNCDNYYKGFPSEDYDPAIASYINGKIKYVLLKWECGEIGK